MITHPDTNAPSGTRYELTADEAAAGFSTALLTGPISGTIAMTDGSAYDVTPDVIAVKPEHVRELQISIHKSHHAAGRYLDAPLPSA